MKLIPNLTIKKQITMLFVVFTVILVGFDFFNYYSLKNYDKSIQNIKNSTLRKLSIIGEISINTAINQSNIFHYLYSYSIEDKILYSKKITEKIEQNDVLFKNLIEVIIQDKTQENLDLVSKVRIAYIDKIREIIERDPSPNSGAF